MASSAEHRSLKSPSSSQSTNSSFTQAARSNRPPVPTISVITTPPWARDEPPSPKLETPLDGQRQSESHPSDIASYRSSSTDLPGVSRWWTFNRQRLNPPLQSATDGITNSPKPERRGLGLRDRTISWLPSAGIRRSTEGASYGQISKEKSREEESGTPMHVPPPGEHDWHITMPTPVLPTNMPINMTPGWGVPWSPGLQEVGLPGSLSRVDTAQGYGNMTPWKRRRKKFRKFILSNTYVPLLFRFINITFTTAALAIAIRIRAMEMRNHVLGAVGSSPILVIIFAPLTLLHVMASVYLEYFGRPLGLWRTSGKLTHTLSEVLFICAWSAALSLCFDNYFTSNIPCTSPSMTSWYNQIPRPPSPLPDLGRHEGGVADQICDDQVALICLVFVGLIMYCSNLVISLFRIFEKVKYHPAASSRTG